MIDLTPLQAELIRAKQALIDSQAEHDRLVAEHEGTAATLQSLRARPTASDFPDPESWRQAVGTHRFELSRAITKRRELDAQHIAAAAQLRKDIAARTAATVICDLAGALNDLDEGKGNFVAVQLARAAYFDLPAELRPHNPELLAAISAAQLIALGLAPAAHTRA